MNRTKKRKPFLKFVVCFALIFALTATACFSAPSFISKSSKYRQIEKYSAGDVVTAGTAGELTVHFIDVGQGDACLIELPDNRTMLIDAGENTNKVRDKLKTYMEGVNETRKNNSRPEILFFDFVVLTHSDADHCGSLAYILGLYPAKTFYRPNEEAAYEDSNKQKYRDPAHDGVNSRNKFWSDGSGHSSKTTVTYKNAIETGYKYNSTQYITPDGIVTNPHDDTQNVIKPIDNSRPNQYYEINFYGPVKSKYTDLNNNSPIIIVEYKDRKIALSSDSEKDGEADFVTKAKEGQGRYSIFNDNFSVDIIKAGHHGSRTSSNENYLNTLTAAARVKYVYIVISSGAGNSYGHPHAEVLERFNQMNFSAERILRTDLSQDLVFALVLVEDTEQASVKLIAEEAEPIPEPKPTPEPEPEPTAKPFWQRCGIFAGINPEAEMSANKEISTFILISTVIFTCVLTIFVKRKRRDNNFY